VAITRPKRNSGGKWPLRLRRTKETGSHQTQSDEGRLSVSRRLQFILESPSALETSPKQEIVAKAKRIIDGASTRGRRDDSPAGRSAGCTRAARHQQTRLHSEEVMFTDKKSQSAAHIDLCASPQPLVRFIEADTALGAAVLGAIFRCA
jgi:hypothetical protein